MKKLSHITLALLALAISGQAVAQITFYEREGFQGRSFTTERTINNLERFGFNDRASSVVVLRDRWNEANLWRTLAALACFAGSVALLATRSAPAR